MVKTANCIIGAAFGDEGKGAQVDYLASKYNADGVVIRFNGGAQAGHTVHTPGGRNHIFHHIGSGSFAGAATYLSRHFIINPIMFRQEYEDLYNIYHHHPYVMVDKHCMVTDPFDMMRNQIKEASRTERHGSCGLGINETVTRHKDHKHPFCVNDFIKKGCWDGGSGRLPMMKDALLWSRDDYARTVLKDEGFVIPPEYEVFFSDDAIIDHYIDDIDFFLAHTTIVPIKFVQDEFDHYIFEGAQGLLLDEESGFYPHVTRSRTGLTNVMELCHEMDITDLNVSYMTRSYMTKHGAGPMPHELKEKPYRAIVDDTNILNAWQQHLRYSYLNLDLLKQAIQKDLYSAKNNPGISLTPSIGLTCMDQIDDMSSIGYILNNEINFTNMYRFQKTIEQEIQLLIKYISIGSTRNDIIMNEESIWKLI
jgi:adenylosuccinate synthase